MLFYGFRFRSSWQWFNGFIYTRPSFQSILSSHFLQCISSESSLCIRRICLSFLRSLLCLHLDSLSQCLSTFGSTPSIGAVTNVDYSMMLLCFLPLAFVQAFLSMTQSSPTSGIDLSWKIPAETVASSYTKWVDFGVRCVASVQRITISFGGWAGENCASWVKILRLDRME